MAINNSVNNFSNVDVTAASTTRTNLACGTMATQNANTIAVTGGTIQNTTITYSSLTQSRVPYINASNQLETSNVTPTELSYLVGVTSAIQTQFTGKASTATTISAAGLLTGGGDLSANRTITLSQSNIYRQIITDNTTARTLLLTDVNSTILMTTTSSATITIPANATTAIPIGTIIQIIYTGNAADPLVFLTVSPAGGVTLTGFTAVVRASAIITIQKTGTNAWRTLSLNEESTFSPTVFGGTTAGTPSYSAREGRYTRNGNQIIVQIYVVGSLSGAAGSLRVGALPYTVKNVNTYNPVGSARIDLVSLPASATTLVSQGLRNTSSMNFVASTPAGVASDVLVAANYIIWTVLTYEV